MPGRLAGRAHRQDGDLPPATDRLGDTVGRIVTRVCADELDPERLDALFDVGIDEVSWKRQHNYLTLVADHRAGKIVWGTEGVGEQAADRFFAELDPGSPRAAPSAPALDTAGDSARLAWARRAADDPGPPVAERAGQLAAISLDIGPGYAASTRWPAPQAVRCIDPFHVVQVRHEALLVRAGCETPPPGCRGSPVKLRTA